MARNKRPALTSPWKIGFLVSLMMVATSVGVGYLVTRSFGLSWSWVEFGGSWREWTFHQAPFMREMLPLLATVFVLAVVSYIVVTSAVRRYQAYLDSGLDYKNLIRSIKQIDDLKDEGRIKKLANHPELRDFLLNIRKSVDEREKQITSREEAAAKAVDSSDSLAGEASILVSAVMTARDGGFKNELALTRPELKEIEKAIRDNLLTGAAPSTATSAEHISGLAETGRTLSRRLSEIRTELAELADGVRDLEEDVTRLSGSVAKERPHSGAGASVLDRLDGLSEMLGALGDDTKSIAINTALEAGSGNGGVERVVRLADDIREVAARFNAVAGQWADASAEARRALEDESSTHGSPGDQGEAVDRLVRGIGLWSERTAVLSDKLASFGRHFGEALSGVTGETETSEHDEPQGEAPAAAGDGELETTPSWGFGDEDAGAGASADDFERPEPRPVISPEDAQKSASVDVTGFEREKSLFAEVSASDDDDEMFADIPADTNDAADGSDADATPADRDSDVKPPAREPEPVGDAGAEPVTQAINPTPAPQPEPRSQAQPEPGPQAQPEPTRASRPTPSPSESRPAPERIVDDDRLTRQPSTVEDEAAGEEELAIVGAPARSPRQESVEDVIMDLYTLGAVDYDAANAYHNA